MDNQQNPQKDDGINALIDEILGDTPPAKEGEKAPDAGSPLSTLTSNPELMAKLPELISLMGPLLGAPAKRSSETDKKLALLCALKPYLSPKRCETVDYITKISKLGDTIKHIKL